MRKTQIKTEGKKKLQFHSSLNIYGMFSLIFRNDDNFEIRGLVTRSAKKLRFVTGPRFCQKVVAVQADL